MPSANKPDSKSAAPAPTPSTAGPVPSPSAPASAPPPPAPEPSAPLTADEMLTLLMCPACSGDLELYDGANPHKIGTAFCSTCGQRVKVA